MTHSWDDNDFDVTNPDLGLLMSDCPAELSIQSHSLMLNVRRSVKLSRSRECVSSPWGTQVPREVAVLRRAKSFQQPAVSTSIGPSLTRIRSFFDFSREDTLALDSEASSILPQSGKFCAGGDRGLEEDDNQKAEEKVEVDANEEPTSSDVKPNLSDMIIIENYCDAGAHLNNDVEKAVSSGFDKPVAGSAKVDVTETIKKIESALEEALNVGSLKIDVRERIKRIQTAFEGFMPWDSGTGKPKGDLSDVKAVDTVELEKSRNAGVVKLTTPHSDAGSELEQGSDIKDIKRGLHDSSIGDGDQARSLGFVCTDNDSSVKLNQEHNIKEGRLDKLNKVDEVPGDTPEDAAAVNSTPDGAIDDRVIEDMEDEGLCDLNRVKEVASGTELENPTLTESDAFSKEERVSVEMEETGLGALDEVDEVMAVILDFEAINPIVAVGDGFSEPKHVRVNNGTVEEGLQECDRATEGSSCEAGAPKSVGIQCDFIDQLKQGAVIHAETRQYSDRFDMTEGSGYAPVVNIVNDASGELLNEKGFQDSAEVDKAQANLCSDAASGKSENLQSDDIVNVVHKNTPGSAVVDLLLHSETETFEFLEQEVTLKDMGGKGLKDLNGVDDARPNALWDTVSAIPLDISSELKQERVVEEMNDNEPRMPNVTVDEVRPEAGGKSVLSENDTTDISGLPSPLFQLLDYRNGNAFTFLNVQDHFPDVGDCLLHDEEKVCHIQPGYLSQETNLKSLLAPGESWCTPEELISQSSGGKNSDAGRPRVIVNLRRLRIRKSVRPNALKASPTERVVNTPGLHSSDLSQTVKNLRQDDLVLQSHSKKKPDKGNSPLESISPIHSVVDQSPLNVGQDISYSATGAKTVDEPSLEKRGMYGGSLLHVNKIPGTPASVKRLVVESHKNLSEKYRPTRFEDLAGQTTVVKSLTTCISKQKIAPVYLFLGPRGIGKMSTARLFAAGLNCLSLEPKSRPCGSCRECRAVTLEMSPNVQILDAATVRDSSRMKTVVKLSVSQVGHKVIIIKECDSFSTEIWTAFLKVMQEPPANVVLILISTTANRIPLSAISRCRKVHFYNVSEDEIVGRLQALVHQEDLEVEEGALSLIALRSNGSIHDAEIILDQLSHVDKKVTLASVQKHVGLLPDRKLLNLLDFALSADTANTTKTMNEILGSSVEPLLLVSQLGILITNILVENFDVHRESRKSGYFRPSFSSKKMQRRLRQALKILSEAEKYVRVSTDSLTWLTAALLQCASDRPFPPSVVGSLAHTPMSPKSREQRLEMLVSTDVGTAENELHPTHVSELAAEQTHEGHGDRTPKLSEPSSNTVEPFIEKSPVMYERELKEAWPPESEEAEEHNQAPERLNAQETPVAENIHVLEEQDSIELWNRVLQELTSRNLKHLLLTQGRLVSAGVASDGSRAIVELEFQFAIDKHKAERSWRSICSAFQSVLNIPIELRISLMKNVFDEGLLPCNLEGMDDEELALVTQHMSRLKQEADVVSYSTDSHCGSHSKRRRRRARRDWLSTEMIEPEREAWHRSDSGSVPEPMQPTPRYKAMERTSDRPNGEWHSNGMESSFSESVEQYSGSLETVQSRLLVGVKARRPRLRTMLDTPLDESEDIEDTHSNSPEQMPAEFRTDRGLPLEAFCFPCTQRITQFRREPTRDVDLYDGRRDGDSGPSHMVGRGRAQGQAFFLRLLPCKSISTIRFSKASFSDIRCKS